jgi:hypothetical protein
MPESRSSGVKRRRITLESAADAQPSHAHSVHERVSHIAQLLYEWSWSFSDLVGYWIIHNDGARGERSHQKRVKILRALLTDDSNATVKAMRDDSLWMDSMEIATTLLVQEMHTEFKELRQRHIFGQWSAEEDVKNIDLSKAGKELSQNAPIFRNFMIELASNTRSGGGEYQREEEEGYLVMLASILLLKASRNTANRFARMLGLYLYGSGVKRRAIEVLDGLGVIEGYFALTDSKKALSTRSKVCI